MKLDPGDIAELAPVIRAAVRATLDEIAGAESRLDDRLAYGESEAARLLSLPVGTLREFRLAGRIQSIKPGKRVLYPRAALLEFLSDSRS